MIIFKKLETQLSEESQSCKGAFDMYLFFSFDYIVGQKMTIYPIVKSKIKTLSFL